MQKTIENKVFEIERAISSNILPDDIGLFTGKSGVVLFYYYLFLYTNDEKYLDKCLHYLEITLESLNNGGINASFCSGLSGLMYLLDILNKSKLVDISGSEEIKIIEDYVRNEFMRMLAQKDFDFLHGSCGIAWVYLQNYELNIDLISHYVKSLKKSAEEIDSDRIAWVTNNSENNKTKKRINLGLAHGISGIIITLSRIVMLETDSKTAAELLRKSVDFLLSERLNNNFISVFPAYSGIYDKPQNSRLAWCYGDPGNMITLWHAGKALNDEKLTAYSIETGINSLKRDNADKAYIKDTGLCHGAVGLTSIYYRFYLHTRDPRFYDASKTWLDYTLINGNYADGFAGFKKYYNNSLCKMDSALLNGISGVGLTLLTFLNTEIKPDWDTCFMLS
ncbi:lanthionine synthetase C family protein [Bacteroidota bacterium]